MSYKQLDKIKTYKFILVINGKRKLSATIRRPINTCIWRGSVEKLQFHNHRSRLVQGCAVYLKPT